MYLTLLHTLLLFFNITFFVLTSNLFLGNLLLGPQDMHPTLPNSAINGMAPPPTGSTMGSSTANGGSRLGGMTAASSRTGKGSGMTSKGKYKAKERASRMEALQLTFLFLLPLSNLLHCICHVLLSLKYPNKSFLTHINIFDSFTHSVTVL